MKYLAYSAGLLIWLVVNVNVVLGDRSSVQDCSSVSVNAELKDHAKQSGISPIHCSIGGVL